jgi:hypothetical protein
MRIVIDVGGWLGAILLLLAYFLVSTGRVRGSSTRYQALNIIGSVFVGANAVYYGALPSFSINVVWIAIGALALVARPTAEPEPEAVDSETWKEGRSSGRKPSNGR